MSTDAQPLSVTTFTFLREDIEKYNLTPYLEKLKAISENRELVLSNMNTMVFTVDGYNDDPRALCMIKEVQSFFRLLHEEWPYFLFFSVPDREVVLWWLTIIYFSGEQCDGLDDFFIQFDHNKLVAMLKEYSGDAKAMKFKFNLPEVDFTCRHATMLDSLLRMLVSDYKEYAQYLKPRN